ncbi:hypothetical protein EBU24_01180 [bacterium]|nr:hypothetical protein [bacterium]
MTTVCHPEVTKDPFVYTVSHAIILMQAGKLRRNESRRSFNVGGQVNLIKSQSNVIKRKHRIQVKIISILFITLDPSLPQDDILAQCKSQGNKQSKNSKNQNKVF